jgi:SulP family sulfate permease
MPLPLRKAETELNSQHAEDGGFIFPHADHVGHEPATDSTSFLSSQSLNSSFLREIPGSSTESDGGYGMESSIESLSPSQKLSGLSLLRPDSPTTSSFNPSFVAPPPSSSSSPSSRSSSVSLFLPLGPRLTSPLPILPANEIADTTPTATPMGTPRPLSSTPLPSLSQTQINPSQNHVHWRSPRSIALLLGPTSPITPTFPQAHEQTPLLGDCRNNNDNGLHLPHNSTAEHRDLEIGSSGTIATFLHKPKTKLPFSSVFSLSALRPVDIDHIKTKMKHEVQVNVPHYLMLAVNSVPAVLLGCLLNILDGVSCKLFQSTSD